MGNIALNKFADASSSVYPYQPAKAVDGTLTPLNRWVGSSPLPPEPQTPAPNWLRIDLGNTFWINRWVVKQMGAVGWSPNYNLTDYKLQGSLDNANWFDIDSVTNNSANSTDRPFAPRKVRWVRVYITKGLRCNTNFASIVDLEIYEANNPPYLTGLILKSGTMNVDYIPPFSSKTFTYSANVTSTTPDVTVTPTVASGTIKVNGTAVTSGQPSAPITLNGGNTTITIEVTSPDGQMKETYTMTVTKPSKSALLSNLVLNLRGGITPPFNSNTFSYTANASNTTANTTVTPTAQDSAATIRVNGTIVPSGGTSAPITLNTGQNTITVVVTASDNSDTKTYTVVVTKAS